MCTVVVLFRPGHPWPILVAANRDEMASRPWRPPGRHWPDRPDVVAGLDEMAGGTWLGLNRDGVLACVLNRRGTLGPKPGLRSRGELPLEALDHADARTAARALAQIAPDGYRAFNMVVADARQAFWLRLKGPETGEEDTSNGAGETVRRAVEAQALPEGISMITADDRNDERSPRIGFHLPRFRAALAPDPETGDWGEWPTLMASADRAPGQGPHGAMRIETGHGFGTVSSSLIALPTPARFGIKPRWLFAPGPPDQAAYAPVPL